MRATETSSTSRLAARHKRVRTITSDLPTSCPGTLFLRLTGAS